ncbi:hypothetical protein [Nostoc sp. MG11]|uniref:hypothetical protein n=1 Tax=Nostoc sp. MG11 TaxID=2721166 RepID=UPI00186630E3|nr:hypothetical protein [Nostoc sp. MG11]
MNCDHAMMAEIEMDEEIHTETIEKVNLVFTWFTEWTEELLAYAKQNLNHPYEPFMGNFKKEIALTSV